MKPLTLSPSVSGCCRCRRRKSHFQPSAGRASPIDRLAERLPLIWPASTGDGLLELAGRLLDCAGLVAAMHDKQLDRSWLLVRSFQPGASWRPVFLPNPLCVAPWFQCEPLRLARTVGRRQCSRQPSALPGYGRAKRACAQCLARHRAHDQRHSPFGGSQPA